MACDWDHFALTNSIPLHGDPDANPVVDVFIGVDGLSWNTIQDALDTNEFDTTRYHAAPMVSMFPATSDASWTRLLRASRPGSYEYEYYSPPEDKIINQGYLGLLQHALPPVDGLPIDEPEYYEAFDYHANGYLSTVSSYQSNWMALHDSLDNLFFNLSGRAEFAHTFTAYMLELDAMGHMANRALVKKAFLLLMHRIESFRARHPERTFRFTLISDHGLDFISASVQELIAFNEELERVGVRSVQSFAEGRKKPGLFAIPIVHTRVSYLSINTPEEFAPNVAGLSSMARGVDLTMAALPNDPNEPDMKRIGIWRRGERIAQFGYFSATNTYRLDPDDRWSTLGLSVSFIDTTPQDFTDHELFLATIHDQYPDFFYRIRTALGAEGVLYPGQVLVSFKRPYASEGFKVLGGANAIATSGFHGGLDAGGSLGVVITEIRDLPAMVRSDNLLGLFPTLAEHIEAHAYPLHAPMPGAAFIE